MAQKTIRIDDIDGSADADEVRFSLDGKAYEIDLSAENVEALRNTLRPYVEAARRVGGPSGKSTSSDVDVNAVRMWARDHGYEVSDRGRVPLRIVDAYRNR